MVSRELVAAIPKVELHVHLEGSIRPRTLLELAKRNHVQLPATNLTELTSWYSFQDFPHFVEIYTLASSCIKSAEDIELIAWEFAEGQAEQNILYTEATFTAFSIFQASGIPFDVQIEALSSIFDKARTELGTDIRLILDIVRDVAPEQGMMTAEWAIDAQSKRVVGLGLSGIEGKYPVSSHSAAFKKAKDAGLRVTSHAGETQGAASVKEALEHSFADRIGHGVRSTEDPFLIKRLRDEQIHLEVCPTSNICLKVFPSYEEHTLSKMLNEGLNVSINSDDPPMFGTTLTEELFRSAEDLDLSLDMLYSLTRNAVNAAFLPKDEKDALRSRVITGFSEAEDASADESDEDSPESE